MVSYPKARSSRRPILEDDQAALFEGPEPGTVAYFFKDAYTFVDDAGAQHTVTIPGKGVLNNRISSAILRGMNAQGIGTHFLDTANMREQVLLEANGFPFRIVIRNVLVGQRARDLGMGNGEWPIPLMTPVLDFCTHDLEPKFLGSDAVLSLGWVDEDDLDAMRVQSVRANDYLSGLFHGVGLQLYDVALTFGRAPNEFGDREMLLITNQVTPESCTLHDNLNELHCPLNAFVKSQMALPEADRNLGQPYEVIAERLRLFKPVRS